VRRRGFQRRQEEATAGEAVEETDAAGAADTLAVAATPFPKGAGMLFSLLRMPLA
jgi:hypothetical protein